MVAAAVGIGSAVAGLAGSAMQSSAASDAASSQAASAQAAIAEQQRQYNISRGDEMPYMQAGRADLQRLNQLNNGNYSSFHQSPDYKFALQQGIQGLDRSAASRGDIFSGGHLTDLVKYNQGMAEGNYNSYYNKIAGIANLGQDATARTGVLGAGAANGIADQYNNIGNAQALGAIGSANAFASGMGSLQNMLTGSSYGGTPGVSNGSYTGPLNFSASGFDPYGGSVGFGWGG